MASNTDNKTLLQTNNLQIRKNLQVVIVYTEWNEHIVNELVAGAMTIFKQFPQVKVSAYKVPGCVEIPNAVSQVYCKNGGDVFIAFGCVIRGETPHFDYVCEAVTYGITRLNTSVRWDSPLKVGFPPVIFGILTVNTEQEALDRIGGKHGHKGEEAAIAALKMTSLNHEQLQ